jgi:hypothetical protein
MPATTLITVPQFSHLVGLPDSPAVIDVRDWCVAGFCLYLAGAIA